MSFKKYQMFLNRIVLSFRIGFFIILYSYIPHEFQPQIYSQTNPSEEVALADTIPNPHEAYLLIRGIEADEPQFFNPIKMCKNIVFYIPNQIIYGIRFASGYGAQLANDPKFIANLEEFFINDAGNVGWYPIVDLTSDFRPRAGINLFYNQKQMEAAIKGKYADEEKYLLNARLHYRFKARNKTWHMDISGLLEYDDDRIFYGFGHDPRSDPRSYFLPKAVNDFGIYFQKRELLQLVVGFRSRPYWQWFFTSHYQHRLVKDADEKEDPLGQYFDLDNLPGLQNKIQHLYNEISLHFDTTDENAYLSGGIVLEGYAGIANGIGVDKSRFLKMGFDLKTNLPVLQNNRIISPRLVFNMIRNLKDNVSVSFTEYPRQPSFRGVAHRKMLRTDNYSFVPSLEYKWPLSFNLGGLVFLDYLIVAESLHTISLQSIPWAAGFGINFHAIDKELARLQCAVGSEGLRISMSMGLDTFLGDRSNRE